MFTRPSGAVRENGLSIAVVVVHIGIGKRYLSVMGVSNLPKFVLFTCHNQESRMLFVNIQTGGSVYLSCPADESCPGPDLSWMSELQVAETD